jgi:hypothetical protein
MELVEIIHIYYIWTGTDKVYDILAIMGVKLRAIFR